MKKKPSFLLLLGINRTRTPNSTGSHALEPAHRNQIFLPLTQKIRNVHGEGAVSVFAQRLLPDLHAVQIYLAGVVN